ncbi:MAG: SpoIVB peptidase [Clostridia bacterium]|nr:SpoIVB peptidase [Clostridia bacterium]
MKSKFKTIFLIILLLGVMTPASVYAQSESKDNNNTVILGGQPFGIKMFSKGVLVIETENVSTASGSVCPAEEAGIMQNDVIIAAKGEELESNEHLQRIIEDSKGCTVTLKILRDEEYVTAELVPQKDAEGIYRAGMWIRDSAAGIGTVTFYSEELQGFCGLGHGICDIDTGTLMTISSGDVDKAYISSVTKSTDGDVGTLNAYFDNVDIGSATINCNEGIYGSLESTGNATTEIEIAKAQEIETGDAYVYTTISGNEAKAYKAEIVKINQNEEKANLIIKITDEALLEESGGIVQGMSGSPIVQNGKLVGAVTHVIVDDVDCGYGIFAETMFEILEETCR